jgi:hypothetical protein
MAGFLILAKEIELEYLHNKYLLSVANPHTESAVGVPNETHPEHHRWCD